ncbi:MAG: PKD domain-containing protein, partial [Methanobacteriota archaeon]
PYVVYDDLYVDTNVTLTIESGVNVQFENWTSLFVDGYLRILGEKLDRVRLTSNSTAPGPGIWGNLTIRSGGRADVWWTYINYAGDVQIYSDRNTFSYTSFSDVSEGIIVYSSNNTFESIVVRRSSIGGMWFGPRSSDNTIVNSTISGNGGQGIFIDRAMSGVSRLYNSEFFGNQNGGIRAYAASGWEIACNLFSDNDEYGINLYDSTMYIHHNNIYNHTDNAWDNRDWTYWDNGSAGNYWGDYNGTDSDGDGIGDTPYYIMPKNFDYYPLINPVMGCPSLGPLGDPPVAIARPNYQEVNVGQSAWFNGSDSYDPDGWITSYHWNFGDGNEDWGEYVTHAYSSPGNYTVTLTVTDNSSMTDKDYVTVKVRDNYPVAIALPTSQTVNKGQSAWFNGSDSYDPDGWIVSYHWNFGDGNEDWGENVSHAYSALGQYTVALTVTDNDNLTDKDYVTVYVVGYPPVADDGPDQVVHVNDLVIFNGSGSSDPDGVIIDWTWDFGDGSPTKHGEVVNHTYTAVGIYNATLMVTDDDNLTDTDTAIITVLPPLVPPVSDPDGPYYGRKNFPVYITGNGSYDPDGSIVDLEWDFGDGSPKAHGWWLSHVYSSGGNFTITLTVTDDDNLTDTATTYAVIEDQEPGGAEIQEAILSGSGLTDVKISWSLSPDDGGVEDDVVAYEIHYGTTYDKNGAGYALLQTLPSGFTTYTHSNGGHGDNRTYFYIVKAVDDIGQKTFGQQAVKFAGHMPSGMQLISIPVLMSDTAVQKVFQTVDFKRVIYYDAMAGKRHNWRTFDTRKPYNSLKNVNEKMALWVEVSQESYLTVAGLVPLSTTIRLVVGWNFIGYASFFDSTVGDTFDGSIHQKVEGFDPGNSPWYLKRLADSDIMQFGNGYWIHVSEEFIWTVTN